MEQDATAVGGQQTTALMEAAGRGDAEAVRRLLKTGPPADLNAADRHGWTALLMAVEGRHVAAAKLLMEAGADVHHVTTIDGMNALHVLAEQGQRDFFASDADEVEERKAASKLFDMLIDAGVDPNAVNHAGETVLHLLCLRGNLGAVKELVGRKLVTDINAANKRGDTALHYASRKGYREIVDLLVAHGASATVEGEFGTPTQVAREFEQRDIADLLLELSRNSSPEGQAGLWSVPPEVMLHLLSYLGNPRDLCSVSLVCRALAAVSRDDSLWQPLGNEGWAQSGHVGSEGWKGAYMTWLRAATNLYRRGRGITATPVSQLPNSTTHVRDYDYMIKILLAGQCGVGKTCLLLRYVDHSWVDSFISTIGVDFKFNTVDWHGTRVKLQIWDTAGPERFRTITSSYYRGAHAVLLFYDTTDATSLDHARHFKQEVARYAQDDVRVVMVGTKVDLADERAVSQEEAYRQAREWGVPIVECSSKTGEGVDEVFMAAVSQVMGGWSLVPGMGTPIVVPEESEVAALVEVEPLVARSGQATGGSGGKKGKERCCLQ